jgi:hypothetical protein
MAYTQNFGKSASKGTGQSFQDKGLVSPMNTDKDKKKKDTRSGGETPSADVRAGSTGNFTERRQSGRKYGKAMYATKGNSGMVKESYKGMAKSAKTNKLVSFANNNNDKLKSSGEWRLQ